MAREFVAAKTSAKSGVMSSGMKGRVILRETSGNDGENSGLMAVMTAPHRKRVSALREAT